MVVTAANIHEVEAYIEGYDVAAVDTETYGLAFTDKLFSVIIACGDRSFYFNFKDYHDELIFSLLPSIFVDVFNRIFSNRKTWVFHNAKFDLHKLRDFGVALPNGLIWDTKVNARILQNNLLDYSLENLCRGQLNKKSSAVDDYIREHKLYTNRHVPGKKGVVKDLHFDKVPFSIIVPYGLSDGKATLELGLRQMEEYKLRPEQHALRDQENELLKVVFEMESHGIKIDPDYVMQGWKKEEGLIREAEAQFKELTGLDYSTIKKAQLVKILQDAGEIIPKTEKGGDSLKGDVLDGMVSPIAGLINRIRFYEKRISSFYSTFMQYRDSGNIIHANFDQAGTETLRFSSSTPNLQQLSKDDEEDPSQKEEFAIRKCFVPRPGTVFVQWDYKQQEYKLMADYANERSLIRRINDGYDVHKATGELVGVSRQNAKTVNFSILYGSGAPKLAKALGLSVVEARKLINRYYSALPNVEVLINKIRTQGRAQGFIKSTFGARWNISNRDWNYILPNHLIQGTGAFVCKKGMVHIARLLNSSQAKSAMVAMIHDSVIMEMYPEEFHLIPEITRILETVYESKNGVILNTDIEWSAKSLAKQDLTKGAPHELSA